MKNWTKEETLALIERKTITTETGCQEWAGSLTKDGYGQVTEGGLVETFGIRGAHRLAYALYHDHHFTSRNEQVMHSCDNRRCVARDHLVLGTARENMRDASNRGRMRRGEDHVHAKLTEAVVREIKRLVGDGFRNCYIAQKLSVPAVGVSQIRLGKTWRHVTI